MDRWLDSVGNFLFGYLNEQGHEKFCMLINGIFSHNEDAINYFAQGVHIYNHKGQIYKLKYIIKIINYFDYVFYLLCWCPSDPKMHPGL